ncbi:MAG: hypothetical protein Q8916_07220, partial [Bacteroidota bacterium]|nr:hypothetical protein [Bacteroidota bacterium]
MPIPNTKYYNIPLEIGNKLLKNNNLNKKCNCPKQAGIEENNLGPVPVGARCACPFDDFQISQNTPNLSRARAACPYEHCC